MPQLRLALAQVDAVLGDLDGNARMIRDWTARAADDGAQLVAFPEMVLTGYPVEDLALRRSFVDASRAAVHRLLDSATALITLIKGILNDEPSINAMLANLQKFSGMVAKNDTMLRAFLQSAPIAFRNMTNATGSGTALDVNLPAGVLVDSWMCAISQRGKQFNLAQYFTNCSPAPDPFPGWPPPDPARLPR